MGCLDAGSIPARSTILWACNGLDKLPLDKVRAGSRLPQQRKPTTANTNGVQIPVELLAAQAAGFRPGLMA